MLQRPQDNWQPAGRRDLSREITPLLAINGIIVLVLLVLALIFPSASEWISAAVQAEFVDGAPATAPTQIALPNGEMRTVSSN
jgi:hypothetical protein